jgi:hypothetical protein
MTTFKKHFGIPDKTPVDFVDIPLDGDIKLFLDPFLIANNRSSILYNNVYLQLRTFLEKLNRDFIVPNDRVNGLTFLDSLHEPNEYHLGYSDTNKGAAISETRAVTIFDALRNNRFAKAGVSITNEAHNVLLLVTGIGQDIMSDTIANVCRDIFAQFTTAQCLKHSIPTSSYVKHYFNPATGKWENMNFDLPSYKGKPIILLPINIISSKRSYVKHYNYFIAGNRIAKDILDGKIAVTQNGGLIKILSDGSRKAIVKRIYQTYRKPKSDLIQFVLDYNDSLEAFLDYAKENYPSVDFSGLN